MIYPTHYVCHCIASQNQAVMALQNRVQTASQITNAIRLNFKRTLFCCKCFDKKHLAGECPYIRTILQPGQIPADTSVIPANILLLPATNPMLSQIVTTETPISTELWFILMEKLNKANQNYNLVKEAVKKSVNQH